MTEQDMQQLKELIEEARELPNLVPITTDTLFHRNATCAEAKNVKQRPLRIEIEVEELSEDNEQEPVPVDSRVEALEIMLEMEDGSVRNCRIVQTFKMRQREYMVLYPLENNEEDCLAIVRYHVEDNGDVVIEEIVSDEEYDAAEAYFLMLMEEE